MKKAIFVFLLFFSFGSAHAATDVLNDASLGANLISYWQFSETSGTREDSYGNNDLTETGTGGVGYATGIQGNAADFEDGDSDYLYITDAAQTGLDFGSGDFSVSFWLKPESVQQGASSDPRPFGKESATSGNYQYHALYYGNVVGLRSSSNGTSYSQHAPSVTISAGNWYHVVIARSGASSTIYFNGVPKGSGTQVSTFRANAESFTIGTSAQSCGCTRVDGLIDEFGIWSKVLTSADAAALYNSGAGIPYNAGGGSVPKYDGPKMFLLE